MEKRRGGCAGSGNPEGRWQSLGESAKYPKGTASGKSRNNLEK